MQAGLFIDMEGSLIVDSVELIEADDRITIDPSEGEFAVIGMNDESLYLVGQGHDLQEAVNNAAADIYAESDESPPDFDQMVEFIEFSEIDRDSGYGYCVLNVTTFETPVSSRDIYVIPQGELNV